VNRNSRIGRLAGLILVGLSVGGLGMWDSVGAAATPAAGRPLRQGIIKFDPNWDAAKPLAAADSAGWAQVENLLVGQRDQSTLAAYSLESGRFTWQLPITSDLTAPPFALGTTVIVGSRDGRMVRLRVADGSVMWEAKLGSFVNRAMAIQNGLLVAVTGTQLVYGIDAETGQTKWLHDAGFKEGLTLLPSAPPVFVGEQIVVGLPDGNLRAVNVSDGQQAWHFDPSVSSDRFRDFIGGIMVVGSEFVVSRADGLVARIKLVNGRPAVAWSLKLPELATAGFRDHKLYVGTKGGDLIALDIEEAGRHIWRLPTAQPISFVRVTENKVFAFGSNGRVTAVDIAAGETLWTDDVGGDIAVQPMIYREKLLVSTGLKVVYVYGL
jgi:outer membrane protein assembly factor BamB